MMMDIRAILELLPHRYPMLLIDRIVECEPGKRILALKNVTINEPFFNGHFPRLPVMPGVLVVEAAAQAAAVLAFVSAGKKSDDKSIYYLVGIDGARFKRPVVPGDQLLIEVTADRIGRELLKFSAQARVGDTLAAEATLLCTLRPA
jgi:3-hydroxyacyl-[acyl-carrier-protein] dehydratase